MNFILKPNLKLCQNHVANWTRCIYNSVGNTKSVGIQMSEEVRAAIDEERPVVALESAIITHGMPYPHNLSTATSVEAIIRENGATPATVAVLHGKILVGTETHQLHQLAEAKHAVKISTRDYPFAISKGLTGGTTVAATLYAASRCAIRLMATGGIGGVHLEGEKSMDISADLIEMSRTPMAVVSSGIKSILDLDKTLEYMETMGIGLASFNNSKHLPLFFSEQSGRMAPYDVSSSTEAANVLNEWLRLRLRSGLLFAVPVPTHLSIDAGLIRDIIREANDKAKEKGLIGKDITPFLLEHIVTKTSGKSLQTNVGLVKNNAKIAAEIAVASCQLQHSHCSSSTPHLINNSSRNCLSSPVVVGGSNVDYLVKMENDDIQPGGATNLGKITRTFGGVGRNLAEGLARLGLRPIFISAVGQDNLGKELMASIPHSSPRGFFQSPSGRTATYCVVLKRSGDVYLGVGDMAIHHSITPQHVATFSDDLRRAPLVAIDGNTPIEAMESILDICADNQTAVWYEPTDINRAAKPFLTQRWQSLSYISPNIEELRRIHSAVTKDATINEVKVNNDKGDELDLLIEEAVYLSKPLLEHIHCVVVTMGRHGLLVLRNGDLDNPFPIRYVKGGKFTAVYYAAPPVSVTSVSGSGDSLAATMMAGILTGRSPRHCIQAGLQAAAFSLQSERTIPETLSYNALFSGSALDTYSSRVISVT